MSTAATLTVLWVVPVPDFGGVARHVLDVARTGIPGYRLVVCAPEGKLTERLRELNIPVHAVPFGPSRGFRTSSLRSHMLLNERSPLSYTVTSPMRMLSPPLSSTSSRCGGVPTGH